VGKSTALLAAALVPFLAGLRYFKGDLPVDTGLGKILVSRLLLLLMDATILYGFAYFFDRIRENITSRRLGEFGSSSTSDYSSPSSVKDQILNNPASTYLLFIPVYGLYYAHLHLVGPLTFSNQVIQFLINAPTLVLFVFACRSLAEAVNSSYRYIKVS
jgi:hypothetical protein